MKPQKINKNIIINILHSLEDIVYDNEFRMKFRDSKYYTRKSCHPNSFTRGLFEVIYSHVEFAEMAYIGLSSAVIISILHSIENIRYSGEVEIKFKGDYYSVKTAYEPDSFTRELFELIEQHLER